jgi:two-component system cell cycle sensor histidine kinase/response regulator CckA
MPDQTPVQIDAQTLLRELETLRAENARLKERAEKTGLAEEALQLSEERFKSQFKYLPIPTYIWKFNGVDLVLIEFNDAAFAFTEGNVVRVVGSTLRKLYADRPQIRDDIERCFGERVTIKREIPSYQLSSGKIKDLVVTYVFVPPDIVMVHTDDVTESKRAIAALRESEERYRALFENSPVGLGVANEHGTLVAYNEAMMAPGGYTREDIQRIGNVAALYADPDERDAAMALARKQGFLRQHEVRFKRKDGSAYIARMSLQPITLNGQRGWQAMSEDITEQKLAAAALQESEERLRLALEAGAMGTWQWDLVRNTVVWSEQHARLFGIDPEKLDGRPDTFFNAVHPGDRSAMTAEIERSRETRTLFQMEYRIVWPDGRIRWMASRGQNNYDASGVAVQMNGVVMDITERRLAEEKLRKSESSLREAQRIANLGHWEWNIQRDEVEWSDELYRIFARPISDRQISVGTFMAMVHPDDAARVKAALDDALTGRHPYSTDVRVIRGDGAVRTIHAQGDVVTDAAGQPIRMSGTAQDITERILLEAELLQAQKIESVGRLAGGVAHDFNNLLTGIMGYTELLAMRLPPEFSEDIDGIRQVSLRAANLTRQLLGFARKQRVEPKVLNLNDLLANTTSMLTRLIGEHIELRTLPAKDLHHVRVDRGQFEQVLINLVVNACDAMPRGGTLTIRTENERLDDAAARQRGVAPGHYASISVSDTGVGMSDEIRTHVFEPFYTTKDVGKGTGLGLATCYGIVKQHGGDIRVESSPGRGATFTFILPAVDGPVDAALHKPRVVLPGGNESVLLVEDEPMVRSIASLALRSAGFAVKEAGDGIDALRIAGEMARPADLLVTDVVMPRMGGRELAQQLRARWDQLRILYISGYTKDEISDDAGRVAFLPKPFTPDALVHKVREVLDAKV